MCVCVLVRVPPLPLRGPHPYCGAEQQIPHITPQPRSRIRACKQLRDLPLGRTTPSKGLRLFFCIEMSFLWYPGGLSLRFGIEIAFLVSIFRFCCSASRLSSSWDQPVRAFLGLDICKWEVKEDLDTEKKIEKSRYLKKDISIPTKRVTPEKVPEKSWKPRK